MLSGIPFTVHAGLVRLTLLCIEVEAVIPAPISIGINSSGHSVRKYWIPGQARNDNQSKGAFDQVHKQLAQEIIFRRLLKNAQMQGLRNPEE
jgi:hypothetical protein